MVRALELHQRPRADDASIRSILESAGWGCHRTDLEEAFRALVAWPGYASIPNLDAGERKTLLVGVCEALMAAGDTSIMPGDICRLIEDEAEGLSGSTYLAGAQTVLSCPRFFTNLDREAAC